MPSSILEAWGTYTNSSFSEIGDIKALDGSDIMHNHMSLPYDVDPKSKLLTFGLYYATLEEHRGLGRRHISTATHSDDHILIANATGLL